MKQNKRNRGKNGNKNRNRNSGKHKSLKNLNPGEKATIQSAPQKSPLNALGLRAGKNIKTKTKQPFQGPIIASVDGRKVAIDQELASEIVIR